MSRHHATTQIALLLAAIVALAGCAGGPILANPVVVRPEPPRPSATPARSADPQPVVLPRDDGPHDRLTEWWYYTGHLRDRAGHRFGFEYVVFRAERGDLPVSWASHLALTDESGGSFLYAQRSEIGRQVDRSPRGNDGSPTGFDLAINGGDPAAAGAVRTAWTMAGAAGRDRLHATADPSEGGGSGSAGARFGIDLALATDRPVALHHAIGFIDFGPAGGSYYYSRTRMDAAGTVTVDGEDLAVEGIAWFDHQWGDFISVGGGWDWFAVNLEDGTDLTLSLVRAPDGTTPQAYGTFVSADGSTRHLAADAFSVVSTAEWVSVRTGARYPAGWRIEIPGERLAIELRPTVADQELDTRPTTGVVYWEGSQVVRATRDGVALGGTAYVELTGYLDGPQASSAP